LFYKYVAPLEQLLQRSHDKVRYYEKTQAFTIGSLYKYVAPLEQLLSKNPIGI